MLLHDELWEIFVKGGEAGSCSLWPRRISILWKCQKRERERGKARSDHAAMPSLSELPPRKAPPPIKATTASMAVSRILATTAERRKGGKCGVWRQQRACPFHVSRAAAKTGKKEPCTHHPIQEKAMRASRELQ